MKYRNITEYFTKSNCIFFFQFGEVNDKFQKILTSIPSDFQDWVSIILKQKQKQNHWLWRTN